MKLKEAQMLGILALIAVGIILLCMWGGEDGKPDDVTGEEALEFVAGPDVGPSVAELLEELLEDDSAIAERETEAVEEATMEIGGIRASHVEASEEAVIRDVIERSAPAEIPLTPPKRTVRQLEPRPEPEARPTPLTHVVQKNETLSGISQKYYGTSRKWRMILSVNSDVVSDPRLLRPGMRLTIPPLAIAVSDRAVEPTRPALSATEGAAPQRIYVVKKGDTFFDVARRFYGDGMKWKDVHAANRHVVSDPRDLRPGMKLVIP